MKIKYKNKIYSSDDVPLFLYFQTGKQKKDFGTILANYNLGEFTHLSSLHAVLAGNTVIKDKRSKIYFCIESKDEKYIIVKSVFDDKDSDNNAMICSPNDIPEESIVTWIENNIKKIC